MLSMIHPRFQATLILSAMTAAGCTQWIDAVDGASSGGSATGSGGGLAGSGGALAASTAASVGSGGQGGAPLDAILLRGTVVTPDQVFAGEVLIEGDSIACASASCASEPSAASARVIDTEGLLFPGLINASNHSLFSVFDLSDWPSGKIYTSPAGWTSDEQYKTLLSVKKHLNNQQEDGKGPPVDLGCEVEKYGEIRALIAGTTSLVTATGIPERSCYASLARTIDQPTNGLPADKVQVRSTSFSGADLSQVCANFEADKTDAYLIHVGAGTSSPAYKEFAALGEATPSAPGCLYAPQTAIVNGMALQAVDFSVMRTNGMKLVWLPRSNVTLYENTANIPLAMQHNITIALATDWSITGSLNLLDELRYADEYATASWPEAHITRKELVRMVTIEAARVLGLGDVLGSLEKGKKADIMVIGGEGGDPYDALLGATPASVRLVIVGGKPLYGDMHLKPPEPAGALCEDLVVCDQGKFICVATSGPPGDKLGQTLLEIDLALQANQELSKLGLIAPLVSKCK